MPHSYLFILCFVGTGWLSVSCAANPEPGGGQVTFSWLGVLRGPCGVEMGMLKVPLENKPAAQVLCLGTWRAVLTRVAFGWTALRELEETLSHQDMG